MLRYPSRTAPASARAFSSRLTRRSLERGEKGDVVVGEGQNMHVTALALKHRIQPQEHRGDPVASPRVG